MQDLGAMDFTPNINLKELNVQDSGVSSIDVTSCPLLETLICSTNEAVKLNSLDISGNPALLTLRCFGHNIGSLTFTNNTKLVQIICDANPLGSIDVSMLPDLEWLWCWNTGLSTLNVSSNMKLIRLDFGGNSITTGGLSLPNTDTLEYLWGYNNSLTGTINTSPYTNLINFDVTGNELTSVNVSNNIALTDLFVGANELTTIDVSNNPLIEDFDCWMNNLTGDLDVSMLTNLNRFWCYDNQLSNINAKNMNNASIFVFNATNNMSNLCIQVDDKVAATNGYPGWSISPGTVYEESCPGLSINEFLKESISLYPNPTKNKVFLDTEINVSYHLINIQGQEMFKGYLDVGMNEMDLSGLPQGLYFLNLESPDGKYVKKIMKN